MRILVVGGTGFLGGAMASAARAGGHVVTTLSRRAGGPDHISADRSEPLLDLRHHAFDVVLDSCAYTPSMVTHVLDAVGPDLHHYGLISSVSAYSDMSDPDTNEGDPSRPATDEERAITLPADKRTDAAAYGATYGPLKRSCEDTLVDRIGKRAHLVRVGLLVGPGDYTDRLTWWVRRMDQGGTVPVPRPMGAPIQVIDARDAAAYCVSAAQRGDSGITNLTGPMISRADILARIADITGNKTALEWLPHGAFAQHDTAYWTDLPLMVSPEWGTLAGMLAINTDRAQGRGLALRPLDETIADVLAWDRTRRDTPLACGMVAAQEVALLA